MNKLASVLFFLLLGAPLFASPSYARQFYCTSPHGEVSPDQFNLELITDAGHTDSIELHGGALGFCSGKAPSESLKTAFVYGGRRDFQTFSIGEGSCTDPHAEAWIDHALKRGRSGYFLWRTSRQTRASAYWCEVQNQTVPPRTPEAGVSSVQSPVGLAHPEKLLTDAQRELSSFMGGLLDETLAHEQPWVDHAAEVLSAEQKRTVTPASLVLTIKQKGELLARIVEMEKFNDEVVKLTNLERLKLNLSPLSLNSSLTHAALWMAYDMWLKYYFEHEDSQKGHITSRAERFGYTGWNFLGENIAMGQRTPQEVVTAWMNSPGHRQNILNPKFEEIGVGFLPPTSHNFYGLWAQAFGRKFKNAPEPSQGP